MKPRTASRLAWSLFTIATALAVGAFVFLILGRHTPPPPGTFGFRGFSAIFALAFGTVGALIASRRPENPIGWIFLGDAVASGWQEFTQQYAIYALLDHPGILPAGRVLAWFPAWIWIPITGGLITFLFLLFPTGRMLSKRWRVAVALAMTGVAVGAFSAAFASGPIENFAVANNPFGIPGSRKFLLASENLGLALYSLGILVSAASLIVRFRRSRGEERQQMKWLVSSAVLVVLATSFSFAFQGPQSSVGGNPQWRGVDLVVIFAFLTIPAATGVSILRYRLYDIDLLIKKAVVYAIFAAFITVGYVALVIVPVVILGRQRLGPIFSIILAGIVALAFQPVRNRVQKLANRLVYGKRATPYEAMADFSHRMAGALSLDEILPRMAEAAAQGVGAQRSRVTVLLPAGNRRVATWPPNSTSDSFDRTLAVTHRGEEVGEVAVAKSPADPITPAEEKLLADLASQAGPALYNVRLTEELQASRQRIVAAQDEERRRIERDLHDGAQSQLISLKVKLGLVKQLLSKDPAKAAALVDEVIPEADSTIEGLRDLARGIFPQILVERGLAAALESHILKRGLPARVEADGETATARFGSPVEIAIYFCCLEAMQNASKHAPGRDVRVRLSARDGWLEFSVSDDGDGFDPVVVARGSGLQSMSDRVEAIGGSLRIESSPGRGTKVMGRVPVGSEDQRPDFAESQASFSLSGPNSDLGM